MYELLAPAVGIFLTQASPGQNLTIIMSISTGSGRAYGLIAATGIACGVFLWALFFWVGFGAFLNAYPGSFQSMKLLGGGYVFFLGAKALISSLKPRGRATGRRQRVASPAKAFQAGLIVVTTNPNTALLWVVISMLLASAKMSDAMVLIVGICMSASAFVIYGCYALIFSTDCVTRAYSRAFRYIEATFGLIIGAVGWKLVTDVLREFRA